MGSPAGAQVLPWRQAVEQALYGPDGFFVRGGSAGRGPGAHFRTSVHASPLFARAVLALLSRVDEALDRPDPLDLVDVGAGRGELLRAVLAGAGPGPARRLRPVAVARAPRPDDLPAAIAWTGTVPRCAGLLLATEWLDDVPLDVAVVAPDGAVRQALVDVGSGEERLGPPLPATDAAWLERWWPLSAPSERAEVGRPRDEAWAAALGQLDRGLAVAVDYGHVLGARPAYGTLTGFRAGVEVPPVPDGSCDVTAHVAFDAVAAAGAESGATGSVLVTQRVALRALGASGARPPRELASTDPGAYLRALAVAGEAGELTDPAGLGGHLWLLQPVDLPGRWLDAALY